MTFRVWLLKQHKRQDAVGDLSRDLLVDSTRTRSYEGLKRHLVSKNASNGALDALAKAKDEYERCVR